jgi:WD40 repeat protein
MQCHVQEITQSITADPSGYFIYGGTKGGRIFCWELSTGNLKCSWQAHFKAVNALKISDCGNFCVSGSEDGMVRVWDLISILSNVSTGDIKHVSKTKNTIPFR